MPGGKSGGDPVATYDYVDEDGKLLYQVCRFDNPKTFLQRRPDPNIDHEPVPGVREDWVWNLVGVKRVPYHVDKLLSEIKAGRSIVLVEGEKDADRLRSLGLAATTTAQGAQAWKDSYGDWFYGAKVVIIPDNDSPGKQYAYRAAESILQRAVSVRVLELPNLPEHGDVSDWLDAGNTVADLQAVAKEAKALNGADLLGTAGDEPPPRDDDGHAGGIMPPLDWAEFWSTEEPREDWLLEPFIPLGRQVALYATAKLGKSLLALDVVAAGATGKSILGAAPQAPVRVMYVDQEMTRADLKERLEDLGYGPEDDLSNLVYYQLAPFAGFDTPEGGAELAAHAIAHKVQLVVVDTMASSVAGDENDSDTYRGFYKHSGLRLKQAGISLLRIDHMGKDPSKGQRGSSAKRDDVDVVFNLVQVEDNFALKLQYSRVSWVPQEVPIQRQVEPLLRHVRAASSFPVGTKEVADLLDELEVPLDANRRVAMASLRAANKGKRAGVVDAALRLRNTGIRMQQRHLAAVPDPEEIEEF